MSATTSPRKKLPKNPIVAADPNRARPTTPAQGVARSTYADVLAFARRAGIVALCTIAPLGALAGTVSACGGAAPVRPMPLETPTDPSAVVAPPTGAGTTPAPLTGIAPPATSSTDSTSPTSPTTAPQ